jgi:hypothetical protein
VSKLNDKIDSQGEQMKELAKKAGVPAVTDYNTTNNTMNIVILPFGQTDIH